MPAHSIPRHLPTDAPSPFAPHETLAAALLPHAVDPSANDPAHDLGHLTRVWRNASRIAAVEGGDAGILLAAVLLHDCIHVSKDSPMRNQASAMAAERAAEVLGALGWPTDRIEAVAHAVEAHSFSAGVEPATLEATILRDADRLDAIGAVGVARCFMVSGLMGRPLYDPADPAALSRPIDDISWTLDHFPAKLLGLVGSFRTSEGKRLAVERHERLARFHAEFMDEIG
jgi:uncharacterized protein